MDGLAAGNGRGRLRHPSPVPWAAALVLGALVGSFPGAPPGITPAWGAVAPWRQERFLIGGWGLNTAAAEPQRFLRFADAGLDYIHDSDHGPWFDLERRTVRALDSLRVRRPDLRLQVVLQSTSPSDSAALTGRRDPLRRWSAVRARVASARGANRTATLGWLVWDEPCERATLADATDLVRALRKDPGTAGQLGLVTLLPEPVPGAATCLAGEFGASTPGETWRRYADTYLAAFDADPLPAPCLSFDSYPFQNDGRVEPTYFENLSLARDLAAAHARPGKPIPLWVVIQLSPFKPPGRPMMRSPSIEQTRWQAWCALAFGARAISYWTVGTFADTTRDSRYGMGLLDLRGQPTPRFAPIRDLNRELHAVGNALFRLQPVECFTGEGGEQLISAQQSLARADRVNHVVEAVEPAAAASDCLVGAFKRPGRGDDYLLVVNLDRQATRSFTLRLDVPADSIDEFLPASSRFRRIATRAVVLPVGDLAPASGRLFRVVSPVREHLPGVQRILRAGSAYEYVLPAGVLRVDEATGSRTWVPVARGVPATGRRATARGVVTARP